MRVVFLLGCMFLLFVGLNSGCKKTTPVKVQQTPDYSGRKISPEKHLPAAAVNVQCYNNYWTYFELEVGGKKRKFLMHHSFPRDDWQGRESLVELREE